MLEAFGAETRIFRPHDLPVFDRSSHDHPEVQRLRKECVHCGPGVFMATHFNRYHCGKCSLTYVSKKDEKASARRVRRLLRTCFAV